MRTATVEGNTVYYFTIRKHTVFGKVRETLIPGWWETFDTRAKALSAARAWKNQIKIKRATKGA